MLTLRGEHLYFVAKTPALILNLCTQAKAAQTGSLELTWRQRFEALRNVRPLLRIICETRAPSAR